MFAIDWNIVGVIAALAYCGLLAVLMMRKSLCAAFAHVKAMPRPVQVVTAILVIVATVQAQKSGNGPRHRLARRRSVSARCRLSTTRRPPPT